MLLRNRGCLGTYEMKEREKQDFSNRRNRIIMKA